MRPKSILCLAVALLMSGCYLRADWDAVYPAQRDWAGFVGQYSDSDTGPVTVTSQGLGVYRVAWAVESVPEHDLTVFAAIAAGRCDMVDEIIEKMSPDADDELLANAPALCAGEVDALCEEEPFSSNDLDEQEQCRAFFNRTRGGLAPLDRRQASSARSLVWLAEGRPLRDDLLIAVAPSETEGWAIAQVRALIGYGPRTVFSIFDENLTPGDLLILERGTNEAGTAGLRVYPTSACQNDSSPPLSTHEAVAAVYACIDRLHAGAGGPKPSRSEFFPRLSGETP
ncbi:MAG: hypothetical protein AAFV62_00005 [Pseudomonadota bacterium]